jgi:hypothetical protein
MVGTAIGENIFLDDFAGDDSKARFVMEAESYCRRTGWDAAWYEVHGDKNVFLEGPSALQAAPTSRNGARGNYMETLGSLPGGSAPIDAGYFGGVLDYKLSIQTTGTYRLYVRWTARDDASDSLCAFIVKGDPPYGRLLTGAGPDYFLYHQCRDNWIWDNKGVKDTTYCAYAGFPHSAVWMISEPGDYTIRIAFRESGTALDALVFQTENLPAPSEFGPRQSLFVPENVRLSPPEIAAINGLRDCIAQKREALEGIDAILAKDSALLQRLEQVPGSGEFQGLSFASMVRAREAVYYAIEQQRRYKEVLEKNIEKLEDSLRALGFEPQAILH